jgi:hypothetical protein
LVLRCCCGHFVAFAQKGETLWSFLNDKPKSNIITCIHTSSSFKMMIRTVYCTLKWNRNWWKTCSKWPNCLLSTGRREYILNALYIIIILFVRRTSTVYMTTVQTCTGKVESLKAWWKSFSQEVFWRILMRDTVWCAIRYGMTSLSRQMDASFWGCQRRNS